MGVADPVLRAEPVPTRERSPHQRRDRQHVGCAGRRDRYIHLAVSAAAARPLNGSGSLRDGVLWGAVAAYALVFFALGYVRYAGHRNFVDLGIFAQTAASAFGCFCNPIEGSHWAFHFSPVLYVVGAVVAVWHSALALVAVQALAGALTAPPIYGI